MHTVFRYYPTGSIFFGAICWVAGLSIAWLIGVSGETVPVTPQNNTLLGLNISSHALVNIWSNNLLYAAALVVFGFFSGGIYAAGTFVYNGLILGLYVRKAIAMGINNEAITHRLIFHAPLEVFAFILLGALTFRGIHFYKELIFGDGIMLQKFVPPVNALVLPLALILVAGIIEYATILKF